MRKIAIIHYHEIALKGGNRTFFENALTSNIRESLAEEKIGGVFKLFGRIIVEFNDESDVDSIVAKLKKVFGIAYFAIGFYCDKNFDALKEAIWAEIKFQDFTSFRITSRRSDKSFQYTSQEVDKLLGSFVWEQLEKSEKTPKVDLKNPDLNIVVDITPNRIFFYFDLLKQGEAAQQGKIRGLSGFPARTAGKVVSLISSGFDSPIASWKIMRRGAEVVFVHFHSHPSTSLASKENVKEIIKILNQYQYKSKAYFVPFLNIQKAVMLNCDPAYGVILYRRFMMRIAEELAKREDAKAIVTGDSLAQVASQTLDNMYVVSRVTQLPIFRPLIGENKEDIIELSEKIGTFNISSKPYEDCCSLFVPRHPKTRARLEDVEEIEKKLNIVDLIEDALDRTEVEFFE